MLSNAVKERIDELDEGRKNLLAEKLKQLLDSYDNITRISEEMKRDGVALTKAQERLYLSASTPMGKLANVVGQKVTLSGLLDVGAFNKSLMLVVERHEAFRLLFKEDGRGGVSQWLDPSMQHELDYRDLSTAADPQAELQGAISELLDKPMDFEAGPLFHFSLLRLAEDEHVFVFLTHNLVFDAWSYDVFLSELKRAFQIGFVLFVPFLVIDMVVASILMSMGMLMLPPVMITLPFKVLLFVLVDGWNLLVHSLMVSFQ